MDEPQSSEAMAHSGTQEVSRFPGSLPIADSIPNVHDCSYLDNRIANLPLKLPSRLLTLDEFDQALASGIRRSGVFLYHTECHECSACEPSRVDVQKFVWRDSFKRVLKRGDRSLTIRAGRPIIDELRLSIFNLHRTQRGLGDADSQYRIEDYESFLVDTCLPQTIELSFWKGDVLVGIAIVDCGRTSISAVYTFFDPIHSKLSLGSYSILKQIEYARNSGKQYAYLGMVVLENQHLNYKTRFTPQERWIQGKWVEFT